MERTDSGKDAGEIRGSDAADVPEADLVEQMTPARSDDEREERDEAATPLEVNEADAAEQRRNVPDDEDYPRG
ncbi:hypothetical protein C8K36_102104 [Rhodococcus sp. OK519]|uniref:hypothetical protein n=1 Tax=Rhodococcus sp. OK519 TaxID=2135729 RepID=UPI000D4F370B|nr:hypothetical protein C8K36_102104 [Rhodococcus sp. OK519]